MIVFVIHGVFKSNWYGDTRGLERRVGDLYLFTGLLAGYFIFGVYSCAFNYLHTRWSSQLLR